jgi:Flp pilus assembly protein TadD
MVRRIVDAVTVRFSDRARTAQGHPGTVLRRFAPGSLVAAAVVFNLVVLRAETTEVPNLNDGSMHMAMMQVALHNIDQGRLPLGAWFPDLGLGSAQFLHYQSLPHIIGALVATIFGTANVYYWSLYLLLSLWPLSVYVGARLLGWDRWIAATAALVSPLLVSVAGYGYQDSSYTWSGFGLWTQLWGMLLLPLAWGLGWRAVSQGRHYALAALVIALTIACHFLTGYLALLVLVPWVLVDPSQLRRRLMRAVIVGGGALLIASWVLVPLISQTAWSGNLEYYQGTFYFDSYGAPQVLGWLVTGQLYDSGRFPIVTLLVGVGFVVCISRVRRDIRARAVVAAWMLSLLLYFGRPTLGAVLNILPGSSDLPLHRYIIGVQLAGLVLAGIGAMWLARALLAGVTRLVSRVRVAAAATVIVFAGMALLFPAWSQIAAYNANGAQLMSVQEQADRTDGANLDVLIDMVKAAGDGRAYAGTKANWGRDYTIGSTPVYLELEDDGVDAVGSWLNTESLSSDAEAHFDERNLADYDLFNIKYLILPADHPPPVAAYRLARSGRHTLWEVATSGYLEVVDTTGPAIVANRDDIGPQTAGFIESDALRDLRFPTVAFNGAQAAAPTLDAAAGTPSGQAGTVADQSAALDDGVFSGEVTANRAAVVLLKTTYDPGWQVTVDGVSTQPIMVAPSFVGVQVTPGSHAIVFRFMPYPYYPLLLALGLITLLALILVPPHFAARTVAVTEETVGPGEPTGPVGALRFTGGWRTLRNTRYVIGFLAGVTVLALVAAGIVNLNTAQPDAAQAAADVSAGVTAQRQGHIDDALEDFRQALAHEPRDAVAYYDLGTVQSAQGDTSPAVQDYDAALQFNGNYVPALYNLALLLTPSDPNEAVSLYQRAIEVSPADSAPYLNLGFVLHALGHDSEARTAFAAAVRIDPTLASRVPADLGPPP